MESLSLNLLTDPLIRIRDPDGVLRRVSLPELFVELGRDAVRDFPALRPHQRHPWHALLVQLAALALHRAGESQPWDESDKWRDALLALTPEHPDGSAFCLVAPHDKPAFLQAPVPDGQINGWKAIPTPDALDMLVTSKNHDLKGARMKVVEADDWVFALTSLQTQEGVLGNGKRGISRMNSQYGNRSAVGIAPRGGPGIRWRRDAAALLDARADTTATIGLRDEGGVALLWLAAWDGTTSVAFIELDPFYIEICRRVRIVMDANGVISARDTTSKVKRINSEGRNGITGDAWLPVQEDKALTLTASGFNYSLMVEVVWGGRYRRSIALVPRLEDGVSGVCVIAQGLVRGNGKTEGYHERRIPISTKTVSLLRRGQTDKLAIKASERVKLISVMRRSILLFALSSLFEVRSENPRSDHRTAKKQVELFLRSFESAEDSRFFDDLNREFDAESEEDSHAERLCWLIDLAERAETVLHRAFNIGPQCGERRYKARARALSCFHRALRNEDNIPQLAQYLRRDSAAKEAVL